MIKKMILFGFIALFVSCGKDAVIIEDPIAPTEPDELYEVNLIGFSTDENRVHISDGKIEIDGSSVNSDESGLFHFEKVLIGQKGKIVQLQKEGFLPALYRAANYQSLEQIILNLLMWKAPEKITIAADGGILEDENVKLTIGDKALNQPTEFTFQSFVGDNANHGNSDQLYFGSQTEFLLKEASIFIDGSSALNSDSKIQLELKIDNLNSSDISNLSVFHFDESELTWKQKSIPLTKSGDQLLFMIDGYGWWTLAENIPAQYGTLRLTQQNDIQVKNAEVQLSIENYKGTSVYSSSEGTISTYFPANRTITTSLSDDQFIGEFTSGFSPGVNTGEIIFEDEVQVPIEGLVYACDFTLSDGFVAISSDEQYKVESIENGQFSSEGFENNNEVTLHFYSSNYEFTDSRKSNFESLQSENNSFFSCGDLDDNLVVTDGMNLFQDFNNCRVKVNPRETIVIGENSEVDVFLVSFEGKEKGVFDGLFYHDDILNDVQSEVVVNIILYDEIENKVGGFIKTEYISTGEELSISFIGNIE